MPMVCNNNCCDLVDLCTHCTPTVHIASSLFLVTMRKAKNLPIGRKHNHFPYTGKDRNKVDIFINNEKLERNELNRINNSGIRICERIINNNIELVWKGPVT